MAVTILTKDNFEREALQAKERVLIDFWATWCGPCKMMSPVIDEIAEAGIENLKVCKVNVDEQPDLAADYQVMSIPTLVVLKDGKKMASSLGVQSKSAVVKMVESVS